MKSTLIAYPQGQAQKDELIAMIEAHESADSFRQGWGYWKYGKGCSVGCAMASLGYANDAGNHKVFGKITGYGEELERLNDRVFENLPTEVAKQWAKRFKSAAKPGADLSLVSYQFKHFAVSLAPGRKHKLVKKAIDHVLELLARAGRGEVVTDKEWWEAETAAERAGLDAENAMDNEARSAAKSAMWSAAKNTMRSARGYAERSGLWAAKSHTRKAAWLKMANKLIELIEQAPVSETTNDQASRRGARRTPRGARRARRRAQRGLKWLTS